MLLLPSPLLPCCRLGMPSKAVMGARTGDLQFLALVLIPLLSLNLPLQTQ